MLVSASQTACPKATTAAESSLNVSVNCVAVLLIAVAVAAVVPMADAASKAA